MLLLSPMIFLVSWHVANSIPKDQFYPFGLEHGDEKLEPNDDSSSPEIPLIFGPFKFLESSYDSAYLNVNGQISFNTYIPYYSNVKIDMMPYAIVAGFYADIDTRRIESSFDVGHGQIFYRFILIDFTLYTVSASHGRWGVLLGCVLPPPLEGLGKVLGGAWGRVKFCLLYRPRNPFLNYFLSIF